MKLISVIAAVFLILGNVFGYTSFAQTGWSTATRPYPNLVTTEAAEIECPDLGNIVCAIQYYNGTPTGLELCYPLF